MSELNSVIEQLVIDRDTPIKRSYKIYHWLVLLILIGLPLVGFFAYQQSHATHLTQSDVSAQYSIEVAQQSINPSEQKLQADKAPAQMPLTPTPSTELALKSSSYSRVLDASGHIVARRIATVSSRITGKLNRLNIEEGQQVASKQVLAELDDVQAKIAFQLAVAEVEAQTALLEELELTLAHESKLFARRQALAEARVISDEVVESSELKTQKLGAQIKNRKAQLDLAEQRLALAQYQLDQHKIRAPFDGVVISKNAQVGELISAGSSSGGFIRTGVATIVDMDSLEIEVEVGESYINRVYPGQKVESRLDAYPDWRFSSEVVAIIPTADRQKASIKVRIKMTTSDPRILPDMGVKVSFLS